MAVGDFIHVHVYNNVKTSYIHMYMYTCTCMYMYTCIIHLLVEYCPEFVLLASGSEPTVRLAI